MYDKLCKEPSDINEHLPILKNLAEECESVTEMGTRAIVSTWALVEGAQKKVIAIDYKHPIEYGGDVSSIEARAKERGIEFQFVLGDTREITIEPTDLLFIDTNHTHDQLQVELRRHADKAKKYIVLHDTVSCPEMLPAIDELISQGMWTIKIEYKNNNGLMVLCRK